ncbi:hypothetical protein [Cognatishimia maritima]|uniref:Uncharacterized protein n=1 Tax=Cognatishimia maritima TaxID=870908 RepID=A0A1M5JJ47_9RHOB|nr:hypothetical protein [Cognatishimia maritima]SHG40606.1 hypothetical protein SAMN04488044_0681 [Cognatishimia maritima]
MFVSVYLQRRRILFGMFFYFLSGLLLYGRFGGWAFPEFVIIQALLLAVTLGLLAALLIPMFPSYRNVFETSAIITFLMRIAEAFGFVGDFGMIFETSWGYAAFGIGFAVLLNFLYGAWWSKTSVRLSWAGISSFETNANIAEAWKKLVPKADCPNEFYTGTLYEFSEIEDPNFSHKMKIRQGGPNFSEIQVMVVEENACSNFAYDFSADVSERNRGSYSGHWKIEMSPTETGTKVKVEDRVTATTPAYALSFWFDDLGGQAAVSMKRILEGHRDPTILGWVRRQVSVLS